MIVKDINQLKEKCLPVSSFNYGEGEDIAKQLLDELKNSEGGIGLAANQAGYNRRIFVMDVSNEKDNPQVFDPYKININSGELEKLFENKDPSNPIMNYDFDKDAQKRTINFGGISSIPTEDKCTKYSEDL